MMIKSQGSRYDTHGDIVKPFICINMNYAHFYWFSLFLELKYFKKQIIYSYVSDHECDWKQSLGLN